jgi:hypothetical protein
VLGRPSPDSRRFLRPRPARKETGEDGPYCLICNSRLASHDDANYGGVEWSSRSGRDVCAQTRQNSRQIPRSGAGHVCGSSSGQSDRDFAAIADDCLGSHESPPEREIARNVHRQRCHEAPCESDLAWRPTYVASISQNAEQNVQRPSRVHVSNPGVLRKQGNYAVVVIESGRRLQEDQEKYFRPDCTASLMRPGQK